MKMNSDKCAKHGCRLECRAGESAHPDNWYCPQCEQEENTYAAPKKRKHYAEIIAWANGAEIQYRGRLTNGAWKSINTPAWSTDNEYRVKPQNRVGYAIVSVNMVNSDSNSSQFYCTSRRHLMDNLRLEFAADTGILLSAQVIAPNKHEDGGE